MATTVKSPVAWSTPSFRSPKGFAMITALLVLVAVGALATGAFTLSVFNSRLAQNVQTQAIARYNAERGLDSALLVVAQVYGQLVSSTSEEAGAPNLPDANLFEAYWRSLDNGDDRFLLAPPSGGQAGGYRPAGSSAEIEVRGFAVSGGQVLAEHSVVARIAGVSSVVPSSESTPTTGPGFVTSGSINVSGKGQYDLNIHAGGDVNVEGTGYVGFSYKAGSETCKLSEFVDLDTGEVVEGMECTQNADPPVVSVFDWSSERSKYGSDVGQTDCDETIFSSELVRVGSTSNVYQANLAYADETVVCLGEGISDVVFQGSLSNVVIVGGQDVVVTIEGGSVPAGGSDGLGIRLIAGAVRLVGTGTLSGRNEIYSYSNVVLDRNVTRLVDDDDPNKIIVGTVINSGRDVVFYGDGNADTYAQIVANRAFCRAGNANGDFIGSIEVSQEMITPTNLLDPADRCVRGDQYAIDFRGGSAGNTGFVASLPDEFRTKDRNPVVTYVNRPTEIRVDFRR